MTVRAPFSCVVAQASLLAIQPGRGQPPAKGPGGPGPFFYVRVRDAQQGPDGNLYIATELRSAGAAPDGTVARIEPEK